MRPHLQARSKFDHEHFTEGTTQVQILVWVDFYALQNVVGAVVAQVRNLSELAVGYRLGSVVFGIGAHSKNVDLRFQVADLDSVSEGFPSGLGANFEDTFSFR